MNQGFIGGGTNNSLHMNFVGGTNNNLSIVGGNGNMISTYISGDISGASIFGGSSNQIYGYNTTSLGGTIIGGNSNTIRSSGGQLSRGTIVGGGSNKMATYGSSIMLRNSILGGYSNTIRSNTSGKLYQASIVNGIANNIYCNYYGQIYNCSIFGGRGNTINGNSNIYEQTIVGGRDNSINCSGVGIVFQDSGIFAGMGNRILGTATNRNANVICGGINNTIISGNSFIAAATGCSITGNNNFAIIGANNKTASGLTGPGLLTENLHFFASAQVSDIRQKENIIQLSETKFDAISSIKKIEPISFTWKDKSSNDRQYGFSAQNCEKALPWITNKQRLVRLEYLPEENLYKNIDNSAEKFNPSEYLIQSSVEGPFLITNQGEDDSLKTIKPTSIQALTVLSLKRIIGRVEYLEDKVRELMDKV